MSGKMVISYHTLLRMLRDPRKAINEINDRARNKERERRKDDRTARVVRSDFKTANSCRRRVALTIARDLERQAMQWLVGFPHIRPRP